MLLLVIVAMIATTGFYRRAKRHGLQPGRAATLPFFVLGLMMLVAYVTGLLLARLLDVLAVSDTISRLIWFAFNIFVACSYLAFISNSWLALGKAPLLAEDDEGE